MEKELKPNSHNNFLENRFLRNIFVMAVILTLTLPVSYVVFIHPAFTKLLVEDKVDDAVSIAKHLSSYVPPQFADVGQNYLPVNFLNEAVEHKNDFGLRKLKVFSKSGEVIFSTDTKDVGTINRERYLHEVMEKAKPYTQVVTRDTRSLEGQTMSADVVETYVPLIKDASVLGAFEIYYDITLRKDQLHNLLLRSSATLTILAGGLLSLIMIVLFKEHRTIAQREQTEKKLRDSEERYRSLFANNHAVMLLVDPETADIVDVNPAACSFYGYTREELTSKRITDVNTLSEDEVFLEMQRARAEERKHFYFQHRLAEGEIRDVEVYSGPIALRGKHLLYSIIHDISARKRAEEQVQRAHDELEQRVEKRTAELRASESRLNAAQRMAQIGSWDRDLQKDKLYWSDEQYRIWGYEPGEVAPSHELVRSHIHPEDLKIYDKAHETIFYRQDPYDLEYRIIRKDGAIRTVHSIAEGEWDEAGKPLRHFGCLQDISKRKTVAEVLAQQMQIEMLGAEIGMALARGDTLRTLLQPCAEAMVKHLDAVFARIWTFNEAEDMLELQASAGLYTRIDGSRSRVVLGESKIGVIAQKLQPIVTNSVIGDPLFIDQQWAKREGMVAFAGHPLVTGEKLKGVVAIFSRKPLLDTPLKALASVSNQLALGIRRLWAEEALRKSEKELRFLSSELLTTQENERARIARELHDGIGQALSTMKVRVETFAKIARADVSRLRVEDLENLVPVIRQTIEEVRNTCMDLRPSTLDGLGIVPTIDWFSREFQTTYPFMQIEKEIDIRETDVPDSLKIIIYRIVQEALNNAARHSGAEIMRISLAKTDGEIRLALQDNGQGFDLEDLRSADTAERGFGLTSMKERTELSAGSFSIESSVGQGTTVRASWPL